MRLLLLTLSIILISVNCFACRNFDECMDASHRGFYRTSEKALPPIPIKENVAALKAIAYKLDEISKKLDLSVSIKRAAIQNDLDLYVDCQRGWIKGEICKNLKDKFNKENQ